MSNFFTKTAQATQANKARCGVIEHYWGNTLVALNESGRAVDWNDVVKHVVGNPNPNSEVVRWVQDREVTLKGSSVMGPKVSVREHLRKASFIADYEKNKRELQQARHRAPAEEALTATNRKYGWSVTRIQLKGWISRW